MDLKFCHKTMIFDHYQKQDVKDFQHTIRCHDRFCPLCAKDRANTREMRFNKVLEELSLKYDLFHFTLTLKNCNGYELQATVKQMAKCFQKLRRYLDGSKGIRNIDFKQYGYAGALRSLEITYSDIKGFHPHYHCILALKKGVELPGENYNDFAYDHVAHKVVLFSDFEILMQKIWFLILNNNTVNEQNIDGLNRGYSCRLRKLDKDDYHQTFKYTIKPAADTDSLSFTTFSFLDKALFNMRSVQGYGCFHGLKISDDDIDDSNDIIYDKIIEQLRSYEYPIKVSETPKDVRDQIIQKKCVYTSRRSVRAFVRKYGLEDDLPFIVSEPKKLEQLVQMVMAFKSEKNFVYFDDGNWITCTPDQYAAKLINLRETLTVEGFI